MLSCRRARVAELADTPNKQPVFISTCVLLDEDLRRNKPRIHNTVRRIKKRRLQVVDFASVTNAPKAIPHASSLGFNPTLSAISPMAASRVSNENAEHFCSASLF